MAWTEEAVEPQIRAVENRLDRRHDRDVIAKDREVPDPLRLGLQDRQRGRRHRRLETEAEEDDLAARIGARQRESVHRRIDHPHVGPVGLSLQ